MNRPELISAFLVFLAVAGLSQRLLGQQAETTAEDTWQKAYRAVEHRNENGDLLRIRILSPTDDALSIQSEDGNGRKFPLVLFLHGAGERGNDNEQQLTHGLREFATPEHRTRYPAFVLAPQCPTGAWWAADLRKSEIGIAGTEPQPVITHLMAYLDDFIENNPVDTSRIYITGLSMGGFGTFDIISRWPDRFAAAAPVCGGGDTSAANIERIKALPLWIAHGDADRVVPVSFSQDMVAALKEAGGDPVYVEMSGVGHDSWTATYADEAFFEWLFQQRREERGE